MTRLRAFFVIYAAANPGLLAYGVMALLMAAAVAWLILNTIGSGDGQIEVQKQSTKDWQFWGYVVPIIIGFLASVIGLGGIGRDRGIRNRMGQRPVRPVDEPYANGVFGAGV